METSETNISAITNQALRNFSGSESFVRHPFARNVIFTEGCAFLCRNGAAWLIDTIAIAQFQQALRNEKFQSWQLQVDSDTQSAILIATDGGAEEDHGRVIYKEFYREEIPYTDFPLKELRLFCCSNGEGSNGKTILLTSEY